MGYSAFMRFPLKRLAMDFRTQVFREVFGLYLAKCLIGASVCYGLYVLFPGVQFSWSIVSVLLVLSPDFSDSLRLAFDRIKANLIGASLGLAAYLVRPPDLLSLGASVLGTILVCTFFRLGNATRTALAAVVIVLIQEKERNNWNLGLQRMAAVVIGSLVGLVLTVVFRSLLSRPTPGEGEGSPE